MSNPQQPELARSRKTPAQDQDAVAGVIEGQRDVGEDAPRGPVPPENQPGHHPPKEQDKPDLNAFAEKLGMAETSDGEVQAPQLTPPPAEEPAAQPAIVDRIRSRSWIPALGAVLVALLAVVAGRRIRARRSS